jgi:hypothetical protein
VGVPTFGEGELLIEIEVDCDRPIRIGDLVGRQTMPHQILPRQSHLDRRRSMCSAFAHTINILAGSDRQGNEVVNFKETTPLQSAAGNVNNFFDSLLLDEAKSMKANLLGVFQPAPGSPRPSLVFTAGHGMGFPPQDDRQRTEQGALLCGDYPGFHVVPQSSQYLSSADISDAANVSGLVAFLFACFGGGTPKTDYYPTEDPSGLADPPFVSRLPQRLLSHPNGGALAMRDYWNYIVLGDSTARLRVDRLQPVAPAAPTTG